MRGLGNKFEEHVFLGWLIKCEGGYRLVLVLIDLHRREEKLPGVFPQEGGERGGGTKWYAVLCSNACFEGFVGFSE